MVTSVVQRRIVCIPHWYILLFVDLMLLGQVAYLEIVLFFNVRVRLFFAFMVVMICTTVVLTGWLHYQAYVVTGSCVYLRIERPSRFVVHALTRHAAC